MSHKKGFGKHVLLDLNECNDTALNSIDICFEFLNTLPDQISMTKITQPYVFPYEGKVPDDKGITGMVIIAESHISIHTFPIKNYCFIDIFSCRAFPVAVAVPHVGPWSISHLACNLWGSLHTHQDAPRRARPRTSAPPPPTSRHREQTRVYGAIYPVREANSE